jgi:hypothetical protein
MQMPIRSRRDARDAFCRHPETLRSGAAAATGPPIEFGSDTDR